MKLRAEGEHGVGECAESLERSGASFGAATADGSDSLDRLHRSLGVRSVRALFRRPDGSHFAAQRRRLRERLRAAGPAHPARARRARQPAAAIPDLAHVYRVDLPPGSDAERAAALFRADPHVAYAQPNYYVEPDRLLDDPFLHSQGTWGQAHADLWGLHAVGAPRAWDRTLGEGVVVAVVDTGVDYRHPDIAANLWVHPGEDLDGDGVADPEEMNGRDDDGNGFVDDLRGYDFHDARDVTGDGDFADPEDLGDPDPFDENGHGTHVAGIVAARGGNGIGIAGTAPRATLMPVKAFPAVGPGETDRVWRAVLYAAENGADVINGSFSCSRICRSNPLAEEILRFVTGLGVAFVTSAGNTTSDVMLKSPERLRESIVVGATDPAGGLAEFSSFGLLVDVVAPGRDILSLRSSSAAELYSPSRFVGDGYMRLSGTSMAAPHVSGLLALLVSANPALDLDDLRHLLRLTAEDRGAPGHDRRFGAGLLRAGDALDAPAPPEVAGAILSPRGGDTIDALDGEIAIAGRVGGGDLEAFRLEVGEGAEPTSWTPLAGPRGPGVAGHLARWRIGEVADGAYALRLSLRAPDGLEIREFAPVSLDRNPPRFVSRPSGDALRPRIRGRKVVWEAAREPEEGGEEEPAEEGDLDLLAGRFGREGEAVLLDGAGDQTEAALSEEVMAWLDAGLAGFERDEVQLRVCRARGLGRPCRPVAVAPGPGERSRPAVSGRRLVFVERVGGDLQLRTCEVGPRGCRPRRIAPQAQGPRFPAIDGRQIAWRGFAFGSGQLFTCRLAPGDGGCPMLPLPIRGLDLELRGLSGGILAFEEVSPLDLSRRLAVCRLDPRSGDCTPLPVASRPQAGELASALSRDRVVWHEEGPYGELDVFTCQLDPVAGRCPPQRVTSDAAPQRNPRIDGRRLVWEDQREGVSRIASFELPALAAPRERVGAVGGTLVVPIRALGGVGPARISVTAPGVADVGELGVRLLPVHSRLALLLWRPRTGQAGSYALRLRATTPSGLYAEQELRVDVREPRADRGSRSGAGAR